MTQPTPNYPPVHPPAAPPPPAQAYAPAPGYPPGAPAPVAYAPPPAQAYAPPPAVYAPPPAAYAPPPAAYAPPPAAYAPPPAAAPPPMAIAPSFDEAMALVAQGPGGFDGTEAYDGSEFRIPRASMVQPPPQQKELGVTIGNFALGVGQGFTALMATIVAVAQSRWFGPNYEEAQRLKASGQPVPFWCRSLNGKTSDPTSPHRQAINCGDCPKRFDGCQQSRHVGLLAAGGVYELTIRNKGCQEVDRFVQDRKLARQPLFVAQVRIGTRDETSKATQSTYLVPTIQVVGPASSEDIAKAQEIGPGLLAALTRKGGGDAAEEQGTEPQHQAPAGPGFAPPPGYVPPAPTPAGPPPAAVTDATGAPVDAQWDHVPAPAAPPAGPQPPAAPPGASPNSPVTPAQAQQTWAYIVALGYDGGQVAGALARLFGAQSMEQLTQLQWADLMGRIGARQAL